MSAPPLKIVILGLTLSSSWGNGHATTYRALLKELGRRGHDLLFLECSKPWYQANRDLSAPDYCRLRFYADLDELQSWRSEISSADAVIIGSFVPDGVAVSRFVQDCARGVVAFYDIDTPVTLTKMAHGDYEYLHPALIPEFDVYLSFTGGPTLNLLEDKYGARAARALYCSVDDEVYAPSPVKKAYDLSYLGTFSPDRQEKLERLLLEPARRAPHLKFAVAGPQYPETIKWPTNVRRIDHVAPADHPAFYASSRLTLNITRSDMVAAGYSPSVRLFEAGACGVPVVSDGWTGLDEIFDPQSEIIVVQSADDVLAALALDDDRLCRQAKAARARVLKEHTATIRSVQLERYILEVQERQSGGRIRALAAG